jgi:hypothetical protein
MRRPNFLYVSVASAALCALTSTCWASSQANQNSSWDSSNSNSSWSNDSSSDNSNTNDNSYYSSRKASSRNETRIKQLENQNISPFAPGTNNISLEMGQVFLMGNFGSNFSDSIGEGVHYTYGVSDLFAFDSSMGYSTHSNGEMSMFNATAGLRTNLTWYDKIVPYFAFGLGFYRPSMTVTSGSGSLAASDTVSPILFGVHVGPGVDLAISRNVFFGASLTFHDLFGSTQTTAMGTPVDVSGTYTTFFLHAGYTF